MLGRALRWVDQRTKVELRLEHHPAAWVADGAPAEAAPGPEILAAADAGPSEVVFSPAELATLEALLRCTVGPVRSVRAATDATHDLLTRGVLMEGEHAVALAPSYLWTLGLAAWAPRTVVATGPDARNVAARYALVGRRGVSIVVDGSETTFSVGDSSQIVAALARLLPQPGDDGAASVALAFNWRHQPAPGAVPEPKTEHVEIVVGPGGVRWVARRPGMPDSVHELTHEQAVDRLGGAVVRGEKSDLRIAQEAVARAAACRASKKPRDGLTRYVIEESLDDLWPGLGKSRDPHEKERGHQVGLSLYWRPRHQPLPPPAPSTFVSKRR